MRNCLLVVLGYSPVLWLSFYQPQDMRTLLAGLESAFVFFGGVTEHLLFDQMKTVITRDERMKGAQLVKNGGVHPLREPLGLRAARLSAVPGSDKGEGRAPDQLRSP
jgi:transposase